MKTKIALFVIACSIGISAAFACGPQECGNGKTKCCTDRWGYTYYCTPKPPQE